MQIPIMFAVPGWSVSADALKAQTAPDASKKANGKSATEQNGTANKSRKRKRGHGSNENVEITDENLGDLWRSVIEKSTLGSATSQQQVQAENHTGKKKTSEYTDTTREAGSLKEESFEGLKKDDKDAKSLKQEISLEDAHEQMKLTEEDAVKDRSQTRPGRDPLSQAETEITSKDGKSKYEERKAKAALRREKKKSMRVNGTIPTTRPEPTSSGPTEARPSKPSKESKNPSLPGSTITKQTAPADDMVLAPVSGQKPPLPVVPDPLSTSTKLTPLQQRMAAKLVSARFRHLNQTLYTSPSDKAMRLFAESPQSYTSYHEGFRAQVALWPQNPVDCFIQDIKARGRVSVPSQKKLWREQKKGKKAKASTTGDDGPNNGLASKTVEPLPRNKQGICSITDLGCGDANLASSLQSSKQAIKLNLQSFDLAKGDTPNANLITIADITNLQSVGINNESVDIAICCLSLMGTNWVNVVDECARIVRAGGETWVAEIKSRFAQPAKRAAVQKKGDSIGKAKKKKMTKSSENDEYDVEAIDLSEVDEVAGGRKACKDETDVSAFVDVFKKRGFILKGEPDLNNKMLVRLRFVKASASRAEDPRNGTAFAGVVGVGFKGKQQGGKTTFIDEDEGDGDVDEGRVLKPCVYKTR